MRIITVIFFFLIINTLMAQDIIIKNDGIEIKAKVQEVGLENIRYSKFGADSTRIYVISQADVFQVKYEDGTVDTFTEQVIEELVPEDDYVKTTTEPIFKPSTDFKTSYEFGKADAQKYYKGYKTAGTVTLITTILFPPAGLIPAVASSSTESSDKNLMYPKEELMRSDLDYARGYKAGAKKIKSKKVWNNFLIGFGTAVIFSIIVSAGS